MVFLAIHGLIGVSPEVVDDVDACTSWLFDSDENGESGSNLLTFEAELGQELVHVYLSLCFVDCPIFRFSRSFVAIDDEMDACTRSLRHLGTHIPSTPCDFERENFGTPCCRRPMNLSIDAPQKKSLGSCGYVGLVLHLRAFLKWILVECRTCVGYWTWPLCSRPLHSTRSKERAALFWCGPPGFVS